MTRNNPPVQARLFSAIKFFVICVSLCFVLLACSPSNTDDPNVASIQQLRQDAAVTLPADVAEANDDLLAMAVDAYIAGKQSATDGDDIAAQSYFEDSRDLVSAYMASLNKAVSAQRVEANVAAPLTLQAETIVRQIGSVISGEPSNIRPVANAGGDRTVTSQASVQLDGSASRDADGDALTFSWSLAASPPAATASFSDAASVNPELFFDQAGRYEVVLIVNDGLEDSDPDTALIEVVLANSAPVADAGPDRTVPAGATVNLDGTGSSDIDGDSLTFNWVLTAIPAGSQATLSDSTAIKPSFFADLPGAYVVELVVNDGEVSSQASSVTVDTRNTAPVAVAGADRSVALGERVVLDGGASSDVNGDQLEYQWSITTKPGSSSAQLSDASAVAPSFEVDKPGRYVVTLIVSDGMASSNPDSVTVSTLNVAPVADAGPDQSTFVGEIVILDGRQSSDADGDPLTFSWSLTSIPAGSVTALDDPTAIQPSFGADRSGTYVAQLIVSDGIASSNPDTVAVSTLNVAPVADAGPNQSPFVGESVKLDGRQSSDADGDPLTFSWSLTSIPAESLAALDDPTLIQPSFGADRPGTYIAQLIVNDGEFDSAPATVAINTKNSQPVADAGPDQDVLVDEVVILDGRGSTDADFDDLTYRWSFKRKPGRSNAVIADVTATVTSFVPDRKGRYEVELIVNDGQVDSKANIARIEADD